jgi:hypothetical protein
MFLCARKEAPPVMQSSAAVTVRALVMLACVVGIPVLAMSGTSWSEVLKKFQNFRWPAILNLASASPTAAQGEGPRLPPPSLKNSPGPCRPATEAARPHAADVGTGFRDIQDRLQELGATYYLLESWGNEQQLYRFYCKVAVAGSADYTHCFEAIHADPLQAMTQVLRQVETWRTNGK